MRKTLIILGLIFSILAIILATLPLSNFAFIPALLAFLLGLTAFFISKKSSASNTTVQLIFLLTIISLTLATYKAIFTTTEVGDTKELDQKEEQSKEDALEDLEDVNLDLE